MKHYIDLVAAWLVALHPSAPWVLLTVAIWASAALCRRYAPAAWSWMASVGPESGHLSDVWQALPSVLSGALAGAALTGGDYAGLWKGALAGTLSPLLHWLLKKSPIPYTGKLGGGS